MKGLRSEEHALVLYSLLPISKKQFPGLSAMAYAGVPPPHQPFLSCMSGLGWIWLLHLSRTVCWVRSLMKRAMESWRGTRGRQNVVSCGLLFQWMTSTDSGWSLANKRQENVIHDSRKPPDVSPYTMPAPAMFTIITSVIQRSQLVIQPYDKPTTHW